MKRLSYIDKNGVKQPIGVFNVTPIVVTQEKGNSEEEVMSQKAVTENLNKKADKEEIDAKFSNVEATKLKTPVKLWGQEFDGSKDVSKTIYLGEQDSIHNNCYTSTNVRTLIRYDYYTDILEIGEEVKEINLISPVICVSNITAPNITKIESKLEGITKAADDSKVVKGWNCDTEYDIFPDSIGLLHIETSDGIKFQKTEYKAYNALTIGINEEYVATCEYVDDKIDFLVNSEGQLEDSFDTLKEVDTWIKEHEGEAAEVISDINTIKGWGNNKFVVSINPTSTKERAGYAFIFKSVDGSSNSNATYTIPSATQELAGVMSSTDKTNLDNVVEELPNKATKEELTTLDTELSNAVLSEEVVDNQTFPEIESFTRDELERGLFDKLWINAGGTKTSATTYGLNGIDDLSFEEASNIFLISGTATNAAFTGKEGFASYKYRTMLKPKFASTTHDDFNGTFAYARLEILVLPVYYPSHGRCQTKTLTNTFFGCFYLREILTPIAVVSSTALSRTFEGCSKLEKVYLYDIKGDVNFKWCAVLSLESLQYLVENASNTSPITITVHPDVYAKLTEGDEEWQALNQLALSKQITFATA